MSYPPRQKYSPEQWRQLLEAQAASDQSQVAFCAEHGLSKSSVQHWKRRVTATGSPASTPSTLFAPLAGASGESDTGWTIELDLGDGVCLRLPTYGEPLVADIPNRPEGSGRLVVQVRCPGPSIWKVTSRRS